MKRRRIDVNLTELDQVLEGARQAPLTDPDYEKNSRPHCMRWWMH